MIIDFPSTAFASPFMGRLCRALRAVRFYFAGKVIWTCSSFRSSSAR